MGGGGGGGEASNPNCYGHDPDFLDLRTTVPLVSYIRNSLRVWYYAFLTTCCEYLEKKMVSLENLGESEVKLLRDLSEKSANFSTWATSNIGLLLFFW